MLYVSRKATQKATSGYYSGKTSSQFNTQASCFQDTEKSKGLFFFSHTFMQTFLNEDARRRMLHAGELCSISEKKRAPRTKLEQLGSTSAAMLCLEQSRTFAPEIYSHKLLFNNSWAKMRGYQWGGWDGAWSWGGKTDKPLQEDMAKSLHPKFNDHQHQWHQRCQHMRYIQSGLAKLFKYPKFAFGLKCFC